MSTHNRLARAMCMGIERAKFVQISEWLLDGAANLEIAADEACTAHDERTHRAASDVLGRLARALEAALKNQEERT